MKTQTKPKMYDIVLIDDKLCSFIRYRTTKDKEENSTTISLVEPVIYLNGSIVKDGLTTAYNRIVGKRYRIINQAHYLIYNELDLNIIDARNGIPATLRDFKKHSEHFNKPSFKAGL